MDKPPIDISGTTLEGDFVKTIHLQHPTGTSASILTLGARLIDLRLSNGPPLTLSFSTLSQVEADPAYVGVAVGRTANRIRGGKLRAVPDCALECNESGRNHTHGGRRAWDKRLFAVKEREADRVTLYLFSPDGDQGYPASVDVEVRYRVLEDGLEVVLSTTNVGAENTVTNMTLHPYFDLLGKGGRLPYSALEYELHAPDCAHYLVLDDHQVPTGEVASVVDTRFDFRSKRKIGHVEGKMGYDNYFVADEKSCLDGPIRKLATITASEFEMEVWSNQAGFQLYTSNGFDGKDQMKFACQASIAVEPSGYIDAGNHEAFPSIALQPGETRRQRITYKFRKR